MESYEKRVDPLTGMVSIHTDLSEKPLPRMARRLPVLSGEGCSLCGAVETATTSDRPMSRSRHVGRTAVTTSNRWGPFGDGEPAELVLTRRHATSLEELSDEEVEEFFEHLLSAFASHQRDFDHTIVFINVGQDAGGSQPHLHGQVVSSVAKGESPRRIDVSHRALEEDYDAAKAGGLVLESAPGVQVYVPFAPHGNGELRVVAPNSRELAHAVRDVIARSSAVFGEMNYNVVVHVGSAVVAQVLLRFSHGMMYPTYFDLNVVTVPVEKLASALRQVAYTHPHHSDEN